MTARDRAAELVGDMSSVRPAAGASRRKQGVKALVGTDDGTYQIVEAKMLPIGQVVRNPNQPRQTWDDDKLQELADSIRARGILQPIRVRRLEDGFQIVAGERRLRAAQMVGLTEVPAIVVEQEEAQAYIDSLIENVQREDLNPLDRAEALRQLRLNLGSVPWKEVGAAIGLSERSVFYLLNLSSLPEEIRRDVRSGELTEKHGRALHRLRRDPELQQEAYARIVDERLTGDEALRLTKTLREERLETPAPEPGLAHDMDLAGAVTQLQGALAVLEEAAGSRLPARRRRAIATELEQIGRRLEHLRSRLAD